MLYKIQNCKYTNTHPTNFGTWTTDCLIDYSWDLPDKGITNSKVGILKLKVVERYQFYLHSITYVWKIKLYYKISFSSPWQCLGPKFEKDLAILGQLGLKYSSMSSTNILFFNSDPIHLRFWCHLGTKSINKHSWLAL